MSRDPHPAEAGGVPRPRRRARIAGPWYHSPKAALSGLAVLIAWGLLLPGAILHITQVRTTCGCTSSYVKGDVMKPGDTCQVHKFFCYLS